MGRGLLSRIGGLMATAFVGKQIVDTITKFEKLEASLCVPVTGSADKAGSGVWLYSGHLPPQLRFNWRK